MKNENQIRNPVQYHEKTMALFEKASILARELGFSFVSQEMFCICLMTHGMPMFNYFIEHGATAVDIYMAATNFFLNREDMNFDVLPPFEIIASEKNSNAQRQFKSYISSEERQEIIHIANEINKNASYNMNEDETVDDSQWLSLDVNIYLLNSRAISIAKEQYGTNIIEPSHMTVAFAEIKPLEFSMIMEWVLHKRNNVVRGRYLLDDISDCVAIMDPSEELLINGRNIEIMTLMLMLTKKTRNSVLLVGECGVGKKSIVECFAWMSSRGRCTPNLNYSIVLQVNANAILETQSIEKVYKKLNDFMELNPKTILFIDGIQNLKDNNFLKWLKAKKVKIIATITPYDYTFYFSDDTYFEKHYIYEPHSSSILTMEENQIRWLEKSHGTKLPPKMAELALMASYIFNSKEKNPGRFLNYIDRAMAIAEICGRKEVARQDVLNSFEFDFDKYNSYSMEYKKEIAYHELGHYFVKRALDIVAVSNLFVSIFPKDGAEGMNFIEGSASSVQTRDRQFYIQWITFLLGGRIAETKLCKSVSSGASSDLERANETARDMVCKFALSNLSDVRTYAISGDKIECSQERQKVIDDEIDRILKEAKARCETIIDFYKAQILYVADVLVEKGLLLTSEIEELIREPKE